MLAVRISQLILRAWVYWKLFLELQTKNTKKSQQTFGKFSTFSFVTANTLGIHYFVRHSTNYQKNDLNLYCILTLI